MPNKKIFFQRHDSKEYRFLSNFWFAPFRALSLRWTKSKTYATSEHYYQAWKHYDEDYHDLIRKAPRPHDAMRLGRARPPSEDWEERKLNVMRAALASKFQDKTLKDALLATRGTELIEWAPWGDTFWGVVPTGNDYTGQNRLGKLLMELRDGWQPPGCVQLQDCLKNGLFEEAE